MPHDSPLSERNGASGPRVPAVRIPTLRRARSLVRVALLLDLRGLSATGGRFFARLRSGYELKTTSMRKSSPERSSLLLIHDACRPVFARALRTHSRKETHTPDTLLGA
jgi:hypothetical protein